MGNVLEWLSDKAMWLMGGGFFKGYRTKIVGVVTVLSGVVNLVLGWTFGDMNLVTMLDQVAALPWGNLAWLGIGLGFLAAAKHGEK